MSERVCFPLFLLPCPCGENYVRHFASFAVTLLTCS
jgi:hypothetical protein